MENSDTGTLAVTRDYPRILSVDILTIWIVAIFSRIRISRILSEDTIRGYYPDTGIHGEHCLKVRNEDSSLLLG